MTQVFSPRFGFRVQLVLLVAIGILVGGCLVWRGTVTDPHRLGDPVTQPVPFSHKHHVGDDGLDCRYCHTSVETSAYAGIPPISTCMTCHSQLFTNAPMLRPVVEAWRDRRTFRWNRVYQLPDFVYFDHSIHIAKGVGCVSCHGRVDRMPLVRRVVPLSMKWCLDCHRAPQKYLRPRDRVFDMAWHARDQKRLGLSLVRAYGIDTTRMTDCSLCHR